MNKKEVLEIRKQFTPANCTITRICGCYVDHEKNKKMESKDAFLSLPEEEAFKYFDIFKKTLSGSIGKNLLNMEFPLEQEMPGGTQEFLLKLRSSKLQNDELLEEFYDKVIENYDYPENYYIVLIHAMYDIPGKASDGIEMYDASDNVYEYILCSICPVSLAKAGLSYDTDKNRMADRIRDWIVDKPDKGFLFPAFTDRNTDIHGVMYYTKKSEDLQPELIEQLLGSGMPMSAGEQKHNFMMLIEDVLEEYADFDTVKNIHENLNELIEEFKENPDPVTVDAEMIQRILRNSEVNEQHMEAYQDAYNDNVGKNRTLLAENIAETKVFSVKTQDIDIKVNSDRADLVETREIDGRPCIVIPVDDHIEVNGMSVRTLKRKAAAEN